MFRFAHPDYLYLLLVGPLILIIYLYAFRYKKSAVKKYGDPKLIRAMMPEASLKKQYLKFWMLLMAIIVMVFVIAGPQFGSKLVTVKNKGIEVVVCMDVSYSMLAEDISPNRLEKSKQMLSRMTDGFTNDKVGLIVFAGDAFIQLPITSDYISAKMFIPTIDPSLVTIQGTAIGAAINLAVRSFTPDETSSKTIIIVTDGENHEDDAVKAAADAYAKNITVNVLGVGLPKGAPIPLGNNNYVKDNDGNVVITVLNEQMCQEIAAAGKGTYIRVDNTNAAQRALQKELEKMEKTELEGNIFSEYDERFQLLAWITLILLIAEFFVLERKNRVFKKIKLF